MAIFFCFKIMSFQFWCVLKDLVKFISPICLKVVLKLFILSSSRQSYTKTNWDFGLNNIIFVLLAFNDIFFALSQMFSSFMS